MESIAKLGKVIRERRQKLELSQEDLSYTSKLSVYYISKIERGQSNVSFETLIKLAKALNIKLNQLLKDF